jgi:peroxiredoxin Q/BCP
MVDLPAPLNRKATMATLKVGDRAPDFDLPSTEDRDIQLADLGGKRVVLYFYPRDMTPG